MKHLPEVDMTIYFAMAAAMVLIDQLIKLWAVKALAPIHTMSVIDGVFSLTYVENTGASFSILKGRQEVLIAVTVVAFFLFAFMLKSHMIKGRLGYTAVSFIAGGALGNFIDRVRLGYVIDMFQLKFIEFPVFNFADLCITAGAVLFIIMIYKDSVSEGQGVENGR